VSLATEENTGGVIDGIAARFADADARRRQELDEAIRTGKREQDRKLCPCGCLAPLGECAAGRPRARSENAQPPPAPRPAQPEARKETPMPCGNCGSDMHNRRTCPKPAKDAATTTTKAPAPAPKPQPVAPAKRGPRVELRVETVDELLARRDALFAEIEQVNQRINAAIEAKEAEFAKLKAARAAAATPAPRRTADAA
jgi:hypothetical protein